MHPREMESIKKFTSYLPELKGKCRKYNDLSSKSNSNGLNSKTAIKILKSPAKLGPLRLRQIAQFQGLNEKEQVVTSFPPTDFIARSCKHISFIKNELDKEKKMQSDVKVGADKQLISSTVFHSRNMSILPFNNDKEAENFYTENELRSKTPAYPLYRIRLRDKTPRSISPRLQKLNDINGNDDQYPKTPNMSKPVINLGQLAGKQLLKSSTPESGLNPNIPLEKNITPTEVKQILKELFKKEGHRSNNNRIYSRNLKGGKRTKSCNEKRKKKLESMVLTGKKIEEPLEKEANFQIRSRTPIRLPNYREGMSYKNILSAINGEMECRKKMNERYYSMHDRSASLSTNCSSLSVTSQSYKSPYSKIYTGSNALKGKNEAFHNEYIYPSRQRFNLNQNKFQSINLSKEYNLVGDNGSYIQEQNSILVKIPTIGHYASMAGKNDEGLHTYYNN